MFMYIVFFLYNKVCLIYISYRIRTRNKTIFYRITNIDYYYNISN